MLSCSWILLKGTVFQMLGQCDATGSSSSWDICHVSRVLLKTVAGLPSGNLRIGNQIYTYSIYNDPLLMIVSSYLLNNDEFTI